MVDDKDDNQDSNNGNMKMAAATDPATTKITLQSEEETSSAAKRSKTKSIFDNDDKILSSDLFNRTESIQHSYKSAVPYPYAQVHDLFDPTFLATVRTEIKSQTKVNFKESDLFRVYQSIDLANLVEGSVQATDELPNVMKGDLW
jgi:hypothetical protein